MNKNTKINNETVPYFSHHNWLTNKGNFKGNCPICEKEIKKGDEILVEFDTTNGLSSNCYCSECGNVRLIELSDYYIGLKK